MPDIMGALRQSVEEFKDVLGELVDTREGIIEPPAGADINRPPAEIETGREEVAAQERAARDAARAPYRAAAAPELRFTRVATTGRHQLEDIVTALQHTGLAGAQSASTASTASRTASTAAAAARAAATSSGRSSTRRAA